MTLGSHQRVVGVSQNHLTPRWIVDALGPFHTDPCAADPRPWDCAAVNYTQADDGLRKPWVGYTWLNPPFDQYQVGRWVNRLVDHGNGVALLHARTETKWFRPAWEHASAMLFLYQRLHFCRPDGTEQSANSGAPVVLCAFGALARKRLGHLRHRGAFIEQWSA